MILKRFTWKCRLRSVAAVPSRRGHDWISPDGHDTGIRVYNIHLKKCVPLVFPNKNLVKWYICGPTVYDRSHIGHASCYVRFDIIRRILAEYFDVRPLVALGVTDIADQISKRSADTEEPYREIGKRFEKEFFEQMEALNVSPPHFKLRVSEHMPQVIEFVQGLVDKNAAYLTENGDVYFDVSSDDRYGRFFTPSPDPNAKPKRGKKNLLDFALWKRAADGEVSWESPWGPGKPGWHIECSAMAGHVFGHTVDIHSGGADLIVPHHENEEAQSCSYHGCHQWVNYWLHSGLLQIGDEKMSKSLSNFVTISEFLGSRSSDHFRTFCFMTNYRKDLVYREDFLQLAHHSYEKILALLSTCESYVRGSWTNGRVDESQLLKDVARTKDAIRDCFADDFNTGQAFQHLMNLVGNATRMLNEEKDVTESRSLSAVAGVADFVRHFLASVGFTLGDAVVSSDTGVSSKLESVVDSVVRFRSQVRGAALSSSDKETKKKVLRMCDAMRSDLNANGVMVYDRIGTESNWSFAKSEAKEKAVGV